MHLPKYKPVLADLYKRLLEEIKLRDQWKGVNSSEYSTLVHTHQVKAEALLELLENVTVFHVEGGANVKFGISFDERVKSFSSLKE